MRGYLVTLVVVAALVAPAASLARSAATPDPGLWDLIDAGGRTLGNYFPASANALSGDPADVTQIYALQAAFHWAAGAKDLDVMMSLWAEDATFTIDGQIYQGKSQIRGWFANVAGSFRPQNSWVSLTPSQKIRISVQGDRATLYFECHYVDVKTRELKSQVAADTTLIRSNGRWVIKDLRAGLASLSQ